MNCIRARVEPEIASDPVRDVAEVAQRGREVRLFDLRVQQLRVAAADRLGEVLEVAQVRRRLHLGLGRLVPAHHDPEAAVGVDVHVGLGAEEVPAHRLGGVEPAQLSDDHGAVFVHPGDVLGIRRLPLVLVAEAAAGRMHADRQLLAHAPAQDIDQVDAVVAQLAVAEIPEPVPVVVDQVLVIRLHRRRARPTGPSSARRAALSAP